MGSDDGLKSFLEPKSVALVGVSRRTGQASFNILENLLSHGYRGTVYPVNPHAGEILGIRTYPSVKQIPADVDLAVISTPRELVPPLIKECADKDIRAIVVVAQGFADADEEGKKLQKEVVTIARAGGARVVGPNTFGTANAFIDFSSAFVPVEMARVPVGLICQSGFFFIGFPGLRLIGKGIDLGNACDVDFVDGLESFEDDPQIRLIALHIEGVRDGRRFLEAARRVAQKKPVLVLKTGRSEQAARMARSHTGSLTGNDKVWQAALSSCGLIRVDDIDELSDLVRAFSCLPPMKGNRVGVVSFTGGLGIVAVDSCERNDLELAELSPQAKQTIADMSPPWLNIGNPVDAWPAVSSQASFEQMTKALATNLRALLADPQVDALILMATAFTPAFARDLAEEILETVAAFPHKPLVSYLYGPAVEEARAILNGSGKTMSFPTLERTIRTLSQMARHHRFKS
jgi:acetyltransferase